MREPAIPKSGDEVKASTIADIIRWVKSIVPRGDGKTVQVKTSPGGSIISSYGEKGGTSGVILNLESVMTYSSTFNRYIYNATAYASLQNFLNDNGNSCYAIPVAYQLESSANILNSDSLFLGFFDTYTVSEKDSTAVYLFDFPRWM